MPTTHSLWLTVTQLGHLIAAVEPLQTPGQRAAGCEVQLAQLRTGGHHQLDCGEGSGRAAQVQPAEWRGRPALGVRRGQLSERGVHCRLVTSAGQVQLQQAVPPPLEQRVERLGAGRAAGAGEEQPLQVVGRQPVQAVGGDRGAAAHVQQAELGGGTQQPPQVGAVHPAAARVLQHGHMQLLQRRKPGRRLLAAERAGGDVTCRR